MVVVPDERALPRLPIERVREILAELAWHGDPAKLLHHTGADEGELAEACRIAALLLGALLQEGSA